MWHDLFRLLFSGDKGEKQAWLHNPWKVHDMLSRHKPETGVGGRIRNNEGRPLALQVYEEERARPALGALGADPGTAGADARRGL